MRVAISAGHAKNVRGASASPRPPYLDEYDENVRVVNQVYANLLAGGVTAAKFIDTVSTSQNENLNRIVNWHNAQTRDLDVSVHFNSSSPLQSALMGDEVLYVSNAGHEWATKMAKAIADVAGWPNRGAKYRSDLFFLNNTNKPAILIETCFVSSSGDGNRYRERFAAICSAIAQALGASAEAPEPIPPEPEPAPGERGRVEIVAVGNVTVLVNGVIVYEPTPAPPPNHENITATVFGGSADPNNSAYPPYDALNDTDFYVALPANVTDEAMRRRGVRVWNADTGAMAVGQIRDKGPWMVDDDHYVFGDQEAVAVTCFRTGTPLPRGPNAGRVPSNDAAIDLSPALAAAIGIDGKGKVDWEWIEATA